MRFAVRFSTLSWILSRISRISVQSPSPHGPSEFELNQVRSTDVSDTSLPESIMVVVTGKLRVDRRRTCA